MDESFDSLQSPKRNYVISASIFLGAIADYIAWCTRRAISANDYRFYEFFSESNYLYLHRSE
jgi:hypothetical protein